MVTRTTGVLREGAAVVLDGVDVVLLEVDGPLRSRHGRLSPIKADLIFGGPYRLELAEGRGGTVILTSVSPPGHSGASADFVGSGPLL